MNSIKVFALSVLVWLVGLSGFAQTEFADRLKALPGISDVRKLESSRFKEKYVMKIQQFVDGDNADKGVFSERIFVGFRGYDRPTVIVTEGYEAGYAMNPNYEVELTRLFDANIVVCEYRYFAESIPQPCNWDYLTVANSLRDLHNVRTTIGKVLDGKWISTGVSKGGQTTTFYRAYYPDDVDVSVSYVGPLNKSVEDGRHEIFLGKQVGTKEARAKVLATQQEFLKRKERLLPMFIEYSNKHNYKYYLPVEEIYDYDVLEYSFALWQYGTNVEYRLPKPEDSDSAYFYNLVSVSSPDYFAYPSKYLSFDVQAARELGYYGYSTKGLKKYMTVKNTKGYLNKIMLPPSLRNIKFDNTLYKHTVKFLKKEDPTHIFIYGADDPWSASGVAGWLDCSRKENMRVYVQPSGNHGSCIMTMPEKDEIIQRITNWLTSLRSE